MEALLAQLSNPNNDQRNAMEREFTARCREQPMAALSELLGCARSADEAVRTAALVLMRRMLGPKEAYFAAMTPQTLAEVKQALMGAIVDEPVAHLRKKLAHCLSSLALSVVAESQPWPELVPLALEMCRAEGNAPLQTTGFFLLCELCDDVGLALVGPLHAPICDALFAGVSTATQATSTAVRCAARYLVCLEDPAQQQTLAPLVAPMLTATAGTLNAGDDQAALECVQAFEQIADSNPVFFRPHLQEVGQAMLQISSAAGVEVSVRACCVEMLLTLAEKAPGMIRREKWLVSAVLQLAMSLLSEVDDRTMEEWAAGVDSPLGFGDFLEEDDPSELGGMATDRLVVAMGGAAVFDIAAQAALGAMQSPEWYRQRAGLLSIAMMAAGVKDEMYPSLGAVVQQCCHFLTNEHPRVRYAAAICLGELALEFAEAPDGDGPNFQTMFMDNVLGGVATLLQQDSVPRVQTACCTAIANMFQRETCDAIMDTMPQRMEVVSLLVALLRNPAGTPVPVLETATTAIACIAQVVDGVFAPYYSTVMDTLKQILGTAQGDELANLRGKAMEAIGLVGAAVGAEQFAADAQSLLPVLLQLQTGSVMEGTYLMSTLTRIAHVIREAFLPYLPQVMPAVIGALMANPPPVDDEDDDAMLRALAGRENQEDLQRNAVLFEKSAAVPVAYQYLRDLGPWMGEYLEQLTNALPPLLLHHMSAVRHPAAPAVRQLVEAAVAVQQGTGAPVAQAVFDAVLQPLVLATSKENEFDGMIEMTEALSLTVNAGYESEGLVRLSAEQAESVLGVCRNGLIASRERSRRLRASIESDPDVDEYEVAQAEGHEDMERQYSSNLLDAIGYVIKATGEAGVPLVTQHMVPTLQTWVEPSCPDRIRLIGQLFFIDVVEFGGEAARMFHAPMLALLKSEVSQADVALRQGSVYGFGVCARVMGPEFDGDAAQVAECLRSMIAAPTSRSDPAESEVTDNAISALCNVAVYRANALGSPDVLAWALSLLPLRVDYREAQTLHENLLQWTQQFPEVMAPHAQAVRAICESLIANPVCEFEENAGEVLVNDATLAAMQGMCAQ